MPEQQNTNGCTEESCAGCAHADSCSSKKEDFREPENKYSSIKKVIGVVSGKGGVGKSLVTAARKNDERKRIYSRNFRCGYYRSVYSENVRNT